jgi:hypothetical protein
VSWKPIAVVALSIAIVGTEVAILRSDGGSSDSPASQETRGTSHAGTRRAGRAEILRPNQVRFSPAFSSSDIHPSAQWSFNGRRTTVIVEVGAAAPDRSVGRFMIYRGQKRDTVDVPGAGRLEITNAPEGQRIGRSAQDADIRFRGKTGVSGTLHLVNDTVSIDP